MYVIDPWTPNNPGLLCVILSMGTTQIRMRQLRKDLRGSADGHDK